MSGILLPSKCCCGASTVVGDCCVGYAAHVFANHLVPVTLAIDPWEYLYTNTELDETIYSCRSFSDGTSDCVAGNTYLDNGDLLEYSLSHQGGIFPTEDINIESRKLSFGGTLAVTQRSAYRSGTVNTQTISIGPFQLTYDGFGSWIVSGLSSGSISTLMAKNSPEIDIDPCGAYTCVNSLVRVLGTYIFCTNLICLRFSGRITREGSD